ncbi:RNA polymerase-associated protein rtf1, variant 2 [Xanthoria calcicola]
MSESESESLPAVAQPGTDFPIEGKFKSEKDRTEIMALSEIQRESILAERAQQHERELQNEHLRRLVASKKKEAEAAEGRKRKADTAELEDRQRKSSRQKTALGGRKAGETSGAIEAYKRQREEKGIRDEQRKRDGQERRDRKARGSLEDGYSDADADGESEVDWDDVRTRANESRRHDEQPSEQHDFERVRIGRDNFAKVCFYPGFDDAIKDCYARVNIGPNHATGNSIYRMAKISGFAEGRPYAMEGVNHKNFVTTQYAKVTIGKSERTVPFIACSTAKFTEVEFNDYKNRMLADDLTLPTKPFLISKIGDINRLINHQFTPEEIQQKLERSGVLEQRFNTLERVTLVNRRQKAEARGDEEVVAQLTKEIAEIDGPKLAFNTSLYSASPKPANAGPTQQERLAELNRANRKANAADVRKAQQAERKAEALARKRVERGEAVADPFARVKTRPRTNYDASGERLAPPKPALKATDDLFEDGSKNNSRAGTPGRAGTPVQNGGPKAATPQPPQEKVNGLPKVGKRNMDDDVIGAMDLGIDIEI